MTITRKLVIFENQSGSDLEVHGNEFALLMSSLNKTTKARLATVLRDLIHQVYNEIRSEGDYFVHDHTLDELRQLEHPYSAMDPHYAGLHDIDEAIHIQHSGGRGKSGSGDSIFDQLEVIDDEKNLSFRIGFSDPGAWSVWFMLVDGGLESRMVPRNLPRRIFEDFLPRIRQAVGRGFRDFKRA